MNFSGKKKLPIRDRGDLGIEAHNPCATALAPMQDVTGLAFMRVIAKRGAPDLFFTEFFRVHGHSRLDPEILRSITENPTDRPVFAQLIGESLEDLKRTIDEILEFPIAGIDLNLGCPAPRVYKKNVGGGLLRDPDRIDEILSVLRKSTFGNLSVKMRFGFQDDQHFQDILHILISHQIDLLSLHARTVRGGYKSDPEYGYVSEAAVQLNETCPVFLNGNVSSARDGIELNSFHGSRGVMIGRAAIANPWIFRQIKELRDGQKAFEPKLGDLFGYLVELYEELARPSMHEEKRVSRMKKFLNYIGMSLEGKGSFLDEMRRSTSKTELFSTFSKHLTTDGQSCIPVPYSSPSRRQSAFALKS